MMQKIDPSLQTEKYIINLYFLQKSYIFIGYIFLEPKLGPISIMNIEFN